MALGLIVQSGRILTARLLLGHPIEGLTHCAIGDGDATFTDPLNPPAPSFTQTALANERARKKAYKRTFLEESAEGGLTINGVTYRETGLETRTLGVFFRFEEHEANGITIREYGFFGGTVAYVDGHDSDLAVGGLFHPEVNPDGQVATSGYLYEVKNIPDFNKTADTRLELVGVITI